MAINSSSFPALPSIASLSNLARPRPITLRFPRVSEARPDRKSTRLNSSHLGISYAVFCLKKKNVLFRSDRMSTRLNSSHFCIQQPSLCDSKRHEMIDIRGTDDIDALHAHKAGVCCWHLRS